MSATKLFRECPPRVCTWRSDAIPACTTIPLTDPAIPLAHPLAAYSRHSLNTLLEAYLINTEKGKKKEDRL
jgi:hypothetical protein